MSTQKDRTVKEFREFLSHFTDEATIGGYEGEVVGIGVSEPNPDPDKWYTSKCGWFDNDDPKKDEITEARTWVEEKWRRVNQ